MVSLPEPKFNKTDFFRNPLQHSLGKALWAGWGVDLVAFFLLIGLMTGPLTAQCISFLAAATVSFGIMAVTHHTAIVSGGRILWKMSGLCLALAVLFLRGDLMASLMQLLSYSDPAAFFVAAPMSILVCVVATDHILFDPVNCGPQSEQSWSTLCLALLAYSVLLRFFFLGLPEILHEDGKTMILVGRKPVDLLGPHIDAKVRSGGDVHEVKVQKNGHVIRRNFYRVVVAYNAREIEYPK